MYTSAACHRQGGELPYNYYYSLIVFIEPVGRASARRDCVHVFHPGRLSFCSGRGKPGRERQNLNTQEEAMLSITTPHRKSAGSKTGSNSPFTKRFHASEAAAANSGASPILPARRRKPQKPTLSAKPSAKRSSPSACSTTEEVLTIQII